MWYTVYIIIAQHIETYSTNIAEINQLDGNKWENNFWRLRDISLLISCLDCLYCYTLKNRWVKITPICYNTFYRSWNTLLWGADCFLHLIKTQDKGTLILPLWHFPCTNCKWASPPRAIIGQKSAFRAFSYGQTRQYYLTVTSYLV